MNKTLIASVFLGIFSNNIVVANEKTNKLQQIITEQKKL
jgi:hypothetical protein